MNPEVLQLIIGACLPVVIDVVNTRISNSIVRYVVSLVISLVVGTLLSLDKLNVNDVLQSGAIVFAAAQTTYKIYWQDSAPRAKIFGA